MSRTAIVASLACLAGICAGAPALRAQSQMSSERVRDNPAAQYMLMKTVVGQSIGVTNTRALPVEAAGYNLLKYCWTPFNVLGDWGERSGLTGEMVVRAFETLSWARDLARAGYPDAPVNEAIGRYEAALVDAKFAEAARKRAFDLFVAEMQGLRPKTPGASDIVARERCGQQATSLGLNYATAPEGGRPRFIPYVLHQFCLAQQIPADDSSRCDYWMAAKTDGPMSFAGETVYSVRWPDGTVATGQFSPDEQRTAGTVTLRERPLPKK